MSLAFSGLSPNEEVELKGPIGEFIWLGSNTARVRGIERQIEEIGLVCGGSSVTSILQIARGILLDSETKLWILDSNKTEEDILCQEELNMLGEVYKEKCKIHYTLTRMSESTGEAKRKYSMRRIDGDMVDAHLPAERTNHFIGICGPKEMEQNVKGIVVNSWILITDYLVPR